jgi:hypothetical protein
MLQAESRLAGRGKFLRGWLKLSALSAVKTERRTLYAERCNLRFQLKNKDSKPFITKFE